jgi:hypothetical protein
LPALGSQKAICVVDGYEQDAEEEVLARGRK